MGAREPADRHHPKKSLGQNFLVDANLQRRIVEAVDPQRSDEILEIGPGRGALTRHLVDKARRLILVELDDQLAAQLAIDYGSDPSVAVVHQDILTVDLEKVSEDPQKLKVVGNIPYNITTPIIFHFLEKRPRPRELILMMQREVADRLLAPPGSKTYGALAVGVQAIARVERVLQVGRGAFRPIPDVDSTVVRISPHQPPTLTAKEETALRRLTRAAFGQRRKQFQRILRDHFHLSVSEIGTLQAATGLDLRHRPESFSPGEFIALSRALGGATGG